jgi:hypothetical protein
VTPETKRWQEAAAELAPAKSLDRMMANGRFVISTVTTVGVLLTGFGIVGVERLAGEPAPRLLAALSVPLAVVAVILALYSLLARSRDVNLDNLTEVQTFYTERLRRAPFVTAAGWALIGAIFLAGSAGCWSVLATISGDKTEVVVSLSIRDAASAPKAHLVVALAHVADGATVKLELFAVSQNGSRETLLRGTGRGNGSGELSWDEVVDTSKGSAKYVAKITVDGKSVEVATDV